MAELSSLVFATDTTELERASRAIASLVQDMSQVSVASANMARISAQTEQILARAATESAKARKENARAADIEIKTIIAADKADAARAESIRKAAEAERRRTEATEESTRATRSNVDILQRQNDIYEFLAAGFSKGQAGILATAKATGQLSDELKRVLEAQKQFTSDSFDQSETGLKRLLKTTKEVTDAQRYFNEGSNLTTKQARELSNDLDRLNASLVAQGKSYQEISRAQAIYKQQFLDEAAVVNRANAALDAITKQRREVVSATDYMTTAEQKMTAALNTSNAAIDRSGTDLLVKYEAALRKSGVAQDVATQKLAAYKAQLAQVQVQEDQRRADHLTRTLPAQATDIAVSLWSGQNPLTVLLQQGGQINDLFMQSGVAAEDFAKVVRSSLASMVPAMMTVATGIAEVLGGMFVDAGKSVLDFISDVSGISAAVEQAQRWIVSAGEANFRWIGVMQRFGETATKVMVVGLLALVTTMVAVAMKYKEIIQSENELSKALALNGGAMDMTKESAIAYADSMKQVGVGNLKAQEAMTEFINAGAMGAETMDAAREAAVALEKYAGIALSDTAKEFAKLQDEPSKALIEIAKNTGQVEKATLDVISALEEEQGASAAAAAATVYAAAAKKKAADEIKASLSPIETLWRDIKSAIGQVGQAVYDLATSNEVVNGMRRVWQTVAVIISETWFVLKGVGKEIGGIAAQLGAVLSGDFAGAASIGESMRADAQAARAEHDKLIASIMTKGDVEKKQFTANKAQNSEYAEWLEKNSKALDKSQSKEEQFAIKKKQLQADLKKELIDEVKYNEALAGWKRVIMGEDKKPKAAPKDTFYETSMTKFRDASIEASDATKELTKSQIELMQTVADPKFAKLSEQKKLDILQSGAAAIAKEKEKEATIALGKAEDFREKILGKSQGLGKQYAADMESLMRFAKVAGWTTEQVEEMTRAIFSSTPAFKDYEKAIESVRTATLKNNEASIASQARTAGENEELDYRISLLGRTTEEQKKLQIEYQREQKIREVSVNLGKQLRKIEEDITKAKKDGLKEADYQGLIEDRVQAEQDAAERIKVINKGVAVEYASDLDKEIAAIRGGISDSIVTALFEGGKEGSKKLRSVLVDALRKKVTIVVDAVVNTLMGNVVGSITGGGSVAGSSSGNILGTVSDAINAFGSSVSNSMQSTFSKFALSDAGKSMGLSVAGPDASGYNMLSSTGQGMSTALGVVGDTLAGYAMGSMARELISGGYSTGKGMDTFQKAGSAVGSAIGGPLVGAAIGAVAGVFNRAFGRKLKDVGIEGSFGGEEGFEGNQYKFEKGGWFRSDKTTRDPLSEEMSTAFENRFNSIRVGLGLMATTLGLSAEAVSAFSADVKLSFQGLDADQVNEKITEMFANMSDDMAASILGVTQVTTTTVKELQAVVTGTGDEMLTTYIEVEKQVTNLVKAQSEYAKQGESHTETLTRLSTSLSGVNAVFDVLGLKLYDISLAGGSTASKLADLFGGMDKFTSISASYYENFYTEAERELVLRRQTTDALAKQNLQMPATRDGYRALVEAQDLTTEAGRKNFVVLMQNEAAFASLTPAAAAASKQLVGVNKILNSFNLKTAFKDIDFTKATKDIFESFGVAVEDYSNSISGVLDGILTGKVKAEDAGKSLAEAAVGGITGAIAKAGTDAIAAQFVMSVITPILDNIRSGKAALDGVDVQGGVAKAKQDAVDLKIVLNTLGIDIGNGLKGFADGIVTAGNTATQMIARTSKFAIGGSATGSTTTIYSPSNGSGSGQGLNQYGGVGDSRFAIGGSAGGSYMPPEFQAFGTLASETIESNKKVSELLQKLLNPEKLFENRYKQLDSIAADKRDELVAVQVSRTQGYASTLNRLPGEIAADLQVIEELKDRLKNGGTVADGVIEAMQSQLSAKVGAMAQLEQQLREWYLAQARVIAVEDITALSEEAKAATAKTEELKRTGGLEDPIAKLKNSFAQKFTAIDEGINAVLNAEIAARSADANDAKALMEKYPLMRAWQMSDEEWAKAKHLFGDNIGRNMIKDEAQYMRDVIAEIEDDIAAITDEQQTYIDSLNDWYKAQADLLSTEMLVDINTQIRELESSEKGPLTTIKDAIQKYIDDFKALGTLTDDIQTQIDKLSGLQLTKARKSLYDQLLSPDEVKMRDSYDLNIEFTKLGKVVPDTTQGLRDMIDAANAAGNTTLADSLLELVPAFIALQSSADGVGDALSKLRSDTDDAYAALERAVEAQRKVLNDLITNLRAVFDAAKAGAKTLYKEVDSVKRQSAEAGNLFINEALKALRLNGAVPDSKELQDAMDASIQGVTDAQYETAFDEMRGRLVLAGKLTEIADLTEPQLTLAEKQLKDLDQILETARAQIDELRGINTSVLSVVDAVNALAIAIAAEKAQSGKKPDIGVGTGIPDIGTGQDYIIPPSKPSNSINDIYQQLFGRDAEAAGADYWASTGLTGAALETAIRGGALNDDKSKLPGFDVGINNVPYDMPAYLHAGESVIPSEFNPFNPSASTPLSLTPIGTSGVNQTQDNSDIIEENRLLRQELQAQNGAMVRLLSKVARVVERWDGDGLPEPRTETA